MRKVESMMALTMNIPANDTPCTASPTWPARSETRSVHQHHVMMLPPPLDRYISTACRHDKNFALPEKRHPLHSIHQRRKTLVCMARRKHIKLHGKLCGSDIRLQYMSGLLGGLRPVAGRLSRRASLNFLTHHVARHPAREMFVAGPPCHQVESCVAIECHLTQDGGQARHGAGCDAGKEDGNGMG